MTDPIDPTELLRAANPAKNYVIDPPLVETMLSRVTSAPPARGVILRSWKLRTAAALTAAAAVAAPLALTLSGGSAPPVLNFAAATHAPRSSAASTATGTGAALPSAAPTADFVRLNYNFVAGPGLTSSSASADVFSVTAGADPASSMMDLASALGIGNGTETTSGSNWTIAGANAVLTGSPLVSAPPTPSPIPLGLPKTTMLPRSLPPQTSASNSAPIDTVQPISTTTTPPTSTSAPTSTATSTTASESTAGGAVGSGATATSTSVPVASSTSTLAGSTGSPAIHTPLSWTYSPSCDATATPVSYPPTLGLGTAASSSCAVSSTASNTATSAQLAEWSKSLLSAIESKNLIPSHESLGTPIVDLATNSISYPYKFSDGAVTESVTNSLGASTNLTFQFDGAGGLIYASGLLATTTRLDTYPLVSETAAVGALTSSDLVSATTINPGTIMRVTPSPPIPAQSQTVPGDTGTTSTTPVAAGGGGAGAGGASASTSPTGTAANQSTMPATAPVATTPIETLPVSSAPATSIPPSSVPASSVPASSTTSTAVTNTTLPSSIVSVTETIDSATLGYSIDLLTDGSAVLVPTYIFTASDGSTWRMIALDPADFNTAPTQP